LIHPDAPNTALSCLPAVQERKKPELRAGTAHSRRIVVALAALSVMLLVAIARRDFWYPDEPDMAEITRQMVNSGDWLRLHLYNKLFADYPPLFFWLTSAAGVIGGLSEMVLRLPTTLAALGLLILTAVWARRRLGEEAAFWSVLALGTTSLFVWQSVNMHVDMPFAFFIGASLFCYDAARTADSRRSRVGLLCGAALLMGLASLTKGPAGIVLPLAVMAADHLAHKEYRPVVRLGCIGIGAVCIFGGWALLYAAHAGQSNLFYFIYRQNVTRFLTGHSHLRPFYYYLVNIWADLLPWSLFIVFAIPFAWKAARRGHRPSAFVLLWFAVIFAFFTASRSKRQVYLLPLYPAASMMIGNLLSDLIRRSSRRGPAVCRIALWPVACAFVVAGAGLIAFLPKFVEYLPESAGLAYPVAALSVTGLAGGSAMIVWLKRGRTLTALRALPILAAALCLVGLGWLCPALDDPLSAKADAHWLDRQIDQERGEVAGYFRPTRKMPKESTALSFYGKFRLEVLPSAKEILAYCARQPGDVLLLEDKDMDALLALAVPKVTVVKRIRIGSDRFSAVRLRRRADWIPADATDIGQTE